MQTLSKLCADSLRTFSQKNYNVKLKATHSHELVAAYFGYRSKNSMLADAKYPISKLNKAEIVVMIPDKEIDHRRESLQDLSAGLPDSYSLGEPVYTALFDSDYWGSSFPPFKSFKTLAKTLIDNNESYKAIFKYYLERRVHHIVVPDLQKSEVQLRVLHTLNEPSKSAVVHGETIITLPRVAGHIGFGNAKILPGIWTGGAQRTLGALGLRYE